MICRERFGEKSPQKAESPRGKKNGLSRFWPNPLICKRYSGAPGAMNLSTGQKYSS